MQVNVRLDIWTPGDERCSQPLAKGQITMCAAGLWLLGHQRASACTIEHRPLRSIQRDPRVGIGTQISQSNRLKRCPNQFAIEERLKRPVNARSQVFLLRPVNEKRSAVRDRGDSTAGDVP